MDPFGGLQLPWLAVALAVWYAERCRQPSAAISAAGLPQCGRRLLRTYAPEAVGCAVCAALAAVLLVHGNSVESPGLAEDEAWQEIRRQWPLLATADSLLAIQAMLRSWLLLCAVLQPLSAAGLVDTAPIAGEPAFFFAAAGACRVALLLFSPGHGLEGPLGGPSHLAFEVAALPVLVKLGAGALTRSPARSVALAAAVLTSCRVASQHRLPLAEEPCWDTIFTLVQLLDLLGAVACLVRTAASPRASTAGFAHLAHAALPLQQGLSLYFFLVAFDGSVEQVSVGQPVLLLGASCAGQVGALLLALALHMAAAAADEGEERARAETSGRATPVDAPEVPSSSPPLAQLLF